MGGGFQIFLRGKNSGMTREGSRVGGFQIFLWNKNSGMTEVGQKFWNDVGGGLI